MSRNNPGKKIGDFSETNYEWIKKELQMEMADGSTEKSVGTLWGIHVGFPRKIALQKSSKTLN